MTAASRPSILPKPVTTPSAGVSLPTMSGAIPAWVAWTPISLKLPVSKSRSMRSRTVSLPAACCFSTASSPPIRRILVRFAASSSTSSFMPMGPLLSLHLPGLDQLVNDQVGRRGRAADHRDHRRQLAPVVGRVVGDVLQQWPEFRAERFALGVAVLDDPGEVGRRERVDERPLLPLRHVPPRAELGQRRDLAPRQRRRRGPLPAREPDPVGAVEVGQHAPERRDAELLADLAPGRLLPETRRHVEEPPVRPPVILVEAAHEVESGRVTHRPPLSPAGRPCRLPGPSALPAP